VTQDSWGASALLVERAPELEFFVLRWHTGAFNSLFRGSTLFTMIKWMRHKRIHTKLDGHHPTAASHHRKTVITDDALALMEALDRRDRHQRLQMYHPYTKDGAPIYCHAKILVADDDVFRLGSSNVNNRSFAA
jgi:phosphatidylserine/phosphatidylglycerophosphate/cardiolipin synthase-like enzyme